MDRPVPGMARTAFIVHVIVAAIAGGLLLVVPTFAGSTFGYPEADPDLIPVLRSYGAVLLLFGGLTSLLCLRARTWEAVEIVLKGEIVYLAATSVLYVLYLVTGAGPVLGNVFWLVMHLVMLVLFYLGWRERPA